MDMRRPLVLIALATIGFFLFLTVLSPKAPSGDQGLLPEGPAPPIRIKTPSGDHIALADLKGKVVLVKFWATWCGPCAMSTPHVQALYEKRKNKGLEVIGVALENDDGKQIPDYVREMGVTYPVGMADPPEDVGGWMKPSTGIPTVFLVDRKGKVRWSQSGFAPGREHEMDDAVDRLLNE